MLAERILKGLFARSPRRGAANPVHPAPAATATPITSLCKAFPVRGLRVRPGAVRRATGRRPSLPSQPPRSRSSCRRRSRAPPRSRPGSSLFSVRRCRVVKAVIWTITHAWGRTAVPTAEPSLATLRPNTAWAQLEERTAFRGLNRLRHFDPAKVLLRQSDRLCRLRLRTAAVGETADREGDGAVGAAVGPGRDPRLVAFDDRRRAGVDREPAMDLQVENLEIPFSFRRPDREVGAPGTSGVRFTLSSGRAGSFGLGRSA